jgi:hypothetical protein
MEKLHEMQADFAQEGLSLEIVGLDAHRAVAGHENSARRRSYVRLRRITVVAEEALEDRLARLALEVGATGWSAMPCHGQGRADARSGRAAAVPCVRFEVVAPADVCDRIVSVLHAEILPDHRATICVETVDVVRPDAFVRNDRDGLPPPAANRPEPVRAAH